MTLPQRGNRTCVPISASPSQPLHAQPVVRAHIPRNTMPVQHGQAVMRQGNINGNSIRVSSGGRPGQQAQPRVGPGCGSTSSVQAYPVTVSTRVSPNGGTTVTVAPAASKTSNNLPVQVESINRMTASSSWGSADRLEQSPANSKLSRKLEDATNTPVPTTPVDSPKPTTDISTVALYNGNKNGQKAQEKPLNSEFSLEELTEMPYIVLASMMNERDLCRMDTTCRLLRKLNCVCGPWRALGETAFAGVELEEEGAFALNVVKIDWKSRYKYFKLEAPKFRYPFAGTEITEIKNDDEVAHFKCKLRTDLLCQYQDRGIYVEAEVTSNADNVSLSVVDEEGGMSSVTFTNVTFSPELGAVIKEKIIQDSPRRLKCVYYHPLKPRQAPFEGRMGLFVCNGHIAFFRRYSWESAETQGPGVRRWCGNDENAWETTGFVSDLTWAKDRKLTPCVAFRNGGSYRVKVVRMDSRPPIWPQKATGAYEESNWSTFIWDSEGHVDNV
eukprot:gnl/MRDRNA2_/MRDRNA2_129033_c0_seq1.p1 gnl/MRDRNA2_/MRDRNA2_129033_c0~~gnl/MRDRNA2_/MRDRNA2_129033_c0_seq1.p1  ORF type:complete len:499 (+),score=64.11 gnl/MRDRNA2_/MRDRNA2_129033_c0_seq1:94-1590(+)